MTKEDEAALNEYLNSIFIGRDDAGVDHTREIAPTRTWEAADEHYHKRIEELERYINELKDLLGWTREIHISEGGGE